MKFLLPLFLFTALVQAAVNSDTIVLDATGEKNLRIETVEVEEANFEETIFALGHIQEIPENHGVLSSRISGRVVGLTAQEGDSVTMGQTLVRVESRQPGDPPPVIELKAPIGGLLVESHIRLGEPVEPDKELLDISDLSEVYAVARVPESQAAKLQPGSTAHIRISALGDAAIEGKMLRFGTSADRESGTIDAVFKVANPDLRMRPGMRAEFSLVLGRRENVISIPRAALQGDASKRFVYVKHFDLPHAFIKTPVQVGEVNDRRAEILGGLFPTDEVVTRGAYSLSFAGGGSVSLKAALDAAHGHEHAEDGSELTPEKRAALAKAKAAASGHPVQETQTPLWKYVSAGLLVLLLISVGFRKYQSSSES